MSADVVEHPTLVLARTFDEALTRAARGGAPLNDFERGALTAIYVLADVSGMSNDPRAIAIWDIIHSPMREAPNPRGAA